MAIYGEFQEKKTGKNTLETYELNVFNTSHKLHTLISRIGDFNQAMNQKFNTENVEN